MLRKQQACKRPQLLNLRSNIFTGQHIDTIARHVGYDINLGLCLLHTEQDHAMSKTVVSQPCIESRLSSPNAIATVYTIARTSRIPQHTSASIVRVSQDDLGTIGSGTRVGHNNKISQ